MKISMFNRLPEKGRPHTCDEVISVEEFLAGVKSGRWKHLIEPIRLEEDKKKRDHMKKNIPSVTIGGVFKERKQEELIEHSGFICVDIDEFNDKTALLQDPYTYALFRSASGGGLAVVVKVNKDKHKESYTWLSNYYFVTYGIAVDPAPKNVASLRFVTYDPELYVNTRALQSKTKADKPRKIQTVPLVITSNAVDELVNQIVTSRQNIAADYDSYLRLGFALANGFGEDGRRYYHALCSVSEKYNSQHTDKQFDRCLQGAVKSGITVGTFYHMAKEVGATLPKQNEKAVQVAALAKKSGRTVEGVTMQLQKLNNIPEAEAAAIAQEVFDRDDIDLSKVSGDPDQLIQSLMEWLAQNHPLRKNEITKKIEESGTEINEGRLNSIFLRARMIFNSKDVTKDLVKTIVESDFVPQYNPITEFIEKNRHRNTTGNIDKIITSIKTDTENNRVFIKKWLVSIIAAYDGYPVRSVLALVGGQNTGKTEWFRRLLPDKLKKYYAESKLDNGKDDELLMCEKLIVMDDEMGGKSKQDEKRFKELTSKATFSLRAAYGRHNEDYKRLALLCGTSNDPAVINDPTGNTRILPINVVTIDHDTYNSVDKNELFMELVREYEAGFDWKLTREEIADLQAVSNEFETIPFERELITQFFANANTPGLVESLTSTEIKDYIETNTRQKIMNGRKFSIELKNVLGNSILRKRHGIMQRVYLCVRLNQSHVNLQSTENEPAPF
jgi:predicted P-loop ATPase